jgi:GlpG protein
LIASSRNTGPQRALVVASDENLAPLSRFLHAHGVRHRIFEEQGRQVVETPSDDEAALVVECHRAWRAGSLAIDDSPRAPRAGRPVVTVTAIVAVALLPVTWPLDADRLGAVLPWLTMTTVRVAGDALAFGTLADTWARHELWRFVTPIFLHFSLMHLLLNLGGLAAFGARVERGAGSTAMLAALLVTAVVSNVCQALWNPSTLFGGLSGVDYGLFGFVVGRGRREPQVAMWRLPASFVVSMIAILAAMSSGVTELFGLSIANAAHWSGLASGTVLGFLWPRRR